MQSVVAPLVGAIIGSTIGAYALWRANQSVIESEENRAYRENLGKIASCRQVWINSLRDEIGTFLSLSDIDNPEIKSDELLASRLPSLSKETLLRERATAKMKIFLLLNPSEQGSKCLFSSLAKVENFKTQDEHTCNKADVLSISQAILKIEWDRVKEELGGIKSTTNNREFKEILGKYMDSNKSLFYRANENSFQKH